MHVKSIQIKRFRSFVDSGRLEFDKINVLIGANNAGKSSILRALHQLQGGLADVFGDVRVGNIDSSVDIQLTGVSGRKGWQAAAAGSDCSFAATLKSEDRRGGSLSAQVRNAQGTKLITGDARFPNVEPNHFIVPYLSKRKAATYLEDIREQFVLSVASDVSNLAAKLSRLANPAFPSHRAYAEACESILGFVVTAIPAPSGQKPGIYLPDQSTIPIEQMGEGVPNIVHLLVSLATSTGKLFLVEEPENDLHPIALKSLLNLMIESSSRNQFVVSTHSNIVVRQLCSSPESRLFRVSSPRGVLPPVSTVAPVPQTADARFEVLRELGYEFSDLELWEGWLILEESSAERIVRDYLIPWFTPKLSRIRTIAAGGIDRVDPLLDDFLRLIVFLHLEPLYRNRTWVRVDGDAPGKEIISSLVRKHPGWESDRFGNFSHTQFELYYPAHFGEDVARVLTLADRAVRREAKKELLLNVVNWLNEDSDRGKQALLASAAPVIDELKKIEAHYTR